MKCIYLLIISFFLINDLVAQNLQVTHHLELLSPGVERPYTLNTIIFSQDSTNYIKIKFPEDIITTEYVSLDSAQIKFQTSKISDNKLVTIQFIGIGKIENKVNGKFTALVDGVLMDDMSGTFILIKI